MSRTFSTKNGSVESLKCRWRWGSRPNPRQMRCTVDFESRVWPAIYRTLQCVPPFGFVSSVLRTNWASRSSLIGRGRPERNSSCSPDTPCSRKRRRDLPSREELFSVVAVRLAPCNYPARSGRRDSGHGVAHRTGHTDRSARVWNQSTARSGNGKSLAMSGWRRRTGKLCAAGATRSESVDLVSRASA